MVLGPVVGLGGRAFLPLGLSVARVVASRILGQGTRRAVLGGLGRAAAFTGAVAGVGQVLDVASGVFTTEEGFGDTGMLQPIPAQTPARRIPDIVIGGTGPVTFVKSWRAGDAIFAIDSEGKRWAWRPKLGIWKRTRVFNNIVISRKDVFRARRLIRTSKRLNAIRKGLR